MNNILFDNTTALAHSIIEQACKEYKDAYKKNNTTKCQALEKWFKGPQFDLYTRGQIDPDYFLEMLQGDIDVRRDRKRVKKTWHRKEQNETD